MIGSKIEILIAKYCNNQISNSEIQVLSEWVNKSGNKIIFQEYIALNYNIEKIKEVNPLNKEQVWGFVQTQIKPRKKTVFWKYAVAASVSLFISISFLFNKKTEQTITAPIIVNNIEIGNDKATLTLEDGTEITLEKGQTYIEGNLNSNGEELVYSNLDNITNSTSKIQYNYLTIPRGGQFFVKLTDGTQVWLNSESQLKYPITFINGETRSVELIYGEAYFDVSPSNENNGAKFIVNTQMQEIEVVGTEFNVKAYRDETVIYTTLVEGKVSVKNENENVFLSPGKQSIINTGIQENNITVINVDVTSEISWKKGIFSFKNKSLKDIMKVLSRWYDVDIHFSKKELENIHFKGVLNKNQNIEEILLIIKSMQSINAYEINDKNIIIK